MKDAIVFLRKFNKMYPKMCIGLEYGSNFYPFLDGKLTYEYQFHFKNEIDNDYEYFKSKNLRPPFQDKVARNLKKYWAAYQKEQERLSKPKKFVVEN
jgi:hypothetical protein